MPQNFEVVIRVGTNPVGSLSGNYQYIVYSNNILKAQGSCTVPSGSNVCWSGYKVGGVPESIQVVIDSNNSITESNEGNNSKTVNCVRATLICN